ncbi:MAG: DUF4421 family protein [Bacteroidales bacterium]|nr:DUF4421 family protein [Bacteroidales bacterium]
MNRLFLTLLLLAFAALNGAAQEVVRDSVSTAADSLALAPVRVMDKITAAPEPKRSYWDHGLGKLLKKVDTMLEEGQLSGIDTAYQTIPKYNRQVYLGAYGYWQNYSNFIPFHFPEVVNQQIPALRDQTYYKINAHTHQMEMELGIDWKGLAIEIPIPIRNNYSASYGLAKNGSVWGFRLRFKNINSVSGQKRFGMHDALIDYVREHPEEAEGLNDLIDYVQDERIESDKHNIKIFFAEGYYVFNHKKFSLSAGLFADMVQKRSAGSLMVYANYYQSRYTMHDVLMADYDFYRTQQLSIGAGYGYNYSLMGGRLLFHVSAVPMISLYSHLVHRAKFNTEADRNEYESWYPEGPKFYDPSDKGKSRFRVNAFARFAANYSFGRYVLAFFVNYRYYGYSNDRRLHINNQEADAQINFGYRF